MGKKAKETAVVASSGGDSVSMDANFWAIGAYKRVTKRIDDSGTLIEDLIKMVHDRAQIEKKYVEHLKAFSKRWDSKIEKGPEAGTLRNAWKAVTREAVEVASVHEGVEDRLNEKIVAELTQWKKERYKKGMIGGWKCTKFSEDNFAKATKPWASAKAKAEKARRAYHSLSKSLASLQKKMSECKSGEASQEDIAKLSEKISKLQMDVHQARDRYKTKITELERDMPRYKTEMTAEYDRCQDTEQQRIDYCKKLFNTYHDIVKVDESFGTTWDKLQNVITEVNSDADLVKYTERLGTGMTLYCPKFQEHDEAPEEVAHEQTVAAVAAVGGALRIDDATTHSSATEEYQNAEAETDEDEWDGADDMVPPPPEDIEEGTTVQALYDYEAEDPEEISFKAGDVLTQVEDEDDQGWCKGIHTNGQFGLYPANYVEAISG